MTMFVKDPGSSVAHAVDWDAGYLAGRSLAQSQWSVIPVGLTLTGAQLVGGRTSILLGGGAVGTLYRVTNRVTLSDGSSDERTLVVRVEDR